MRGIGGASCVFFTTDGDGAQNKYCMVQYYFDGPEVEVQIRPRGNAKSNTPFFRTSDSARQLYRERATKHKPKDAVFLATQQQGGEIQVRGMSSLPCNQQQIANYRKGRAQKRSQCSVQHDAGVQSFSRLTRCICAGCEGSFQPRMFSSLTGS